MANQRSTNPEFDQRVLAINERHAAEEWIAQHPRNILEYGDFVIDWQGTGMYSLVERTVAGMLTNMWVPDVFAGRQRVTADLLTRTDRIF